MQYRKLGKRVQEEVSALGFGCMRFPTLPESKEIDREQTDEMLEYAVQNGINYFDTAWPYHGGESENVVGQFLSRGYREKVLLATKMPVWEVSAAGDLDRIFEEQLAKLQTDHIDFYLLHALNSDRWQLCRDVGAAEWAEKRKASGEIRYFGFSFHDSFSVFEQIVNEYDGWDFCQIQYNYLNEMVQAGTAGLAHAAHQGLGIVVMEPLMGGALANPPDSVKAVFDGLNRQDEPGAAGATAVEQAFRWLWDKPDVGTVLSGMSSMDQLRENIEFANRSSVACVKPEERPLFSEARDLYESMRPVACTSCGYCMPCPNGVDIPGNFQILNDLYMFGNERIAKWRYNTGTSEDRRASACVACGECEPKCPQQIPIIESLERVHTELVST